MKSLVFFALYKSFDSNRIGGVDSYVRRLSKELSKSYAVYYILYGAEIDNKILFDDN